MEKKLWKKISRDDVLSWLCWHIELKTKAIDAIEKERDVLERALDLLVEEYSMNDSFDPSKEGRRVTTRFGQPNENQVSESDQRDQEREARVKDGKTEEKQDK